MDMTQDISNKSIIELVNFLIEDFRSCEEILEKINIKLATLRKYLTIIKQVGFNLIKFNKKYKIINFKNQINFKSQDVSMLAHILTLSDSMFSKEKNDEVKLLIEKILYFSSKENYKDFKEKFAFFNSINSCNKYKNKINQFQKYINEQKLLNIKTKNLNNYILKPLRLNWDSQNVFFVFEDIKDKQIREFLPTDIIKIIPVETKFYINNKRETIFELHGRLARTYLLKEDEELLSIQKDKIVVANYSQDKTKLFKRIMRYDVLCKIIQPKSDVEAFEILIQKTLDNLF